MTELMGLLAGLVAFAFIIVFGLRSIPKLKSIFEQVPGRLILSRLAVFLVSLVVLGITLFSVIAVRAQAGSLSVEILAGYNLVVDSNVSSPSTYAPSVATVAGEFCNNTGTVMTDVIGYIGDYSANTPGIYPARTVDAAFLAEHPVLETTPPDTYSFSHLGGSADARRYIGTLQPGECRVQYWHFSYPQCETSVTPPCPAGLDPVWGDSVKPDDDLWLNFDIWAKSPSDGGLTDTKTWTMTMRNEISAMANKIKPNPDGVWFNTNPGDVTPGKPITSNGVRYELGNINQGFDNNGDFVPDYNAWLQPIGDPAYDPSCFRLIRATTVLTVSRSGGLPDLIITATNQLYFTDLPPNNTGVIGVVRYAFLALGGPCSIPLSPYQEVASGFDNEKFNGDYGVGVPPFVSTEATVTMSKGGPDSVALGGTITYTIPFQNNSTEDTAGLVLASGYGVEMPLVISDTVPVGLYYVGGSAVVTNFGYTPSSSPGYKAIFSTDKGQTWTATDPGTTLSTITNPVTIQLWLTDPLPTSPTGSAEAKFAASVPVTYLTDGGDPFIENEACASFGGDTPSFACDEAVTMVEGNNSIGNFVWQDDDGDGMQDAGEPGIDNITVSLYWDRNGDGLLDSGDTLIMTTTTGITTTGIYTFNNLPDGDYLVQVDSNDGDLPTGYSATTSEVHAVTGLSGGTAYDQADFGFGPTLRVVKTLSSLDPAYVGEDVIFHIDLVNTRSGDGTAQGFCTYPIYAHVVNPGGGNPPPPAPPASGSGNSAWLNPNNALNAFDGVYATTNLSDNADTIGLSGFNTAGKTGNITSVSLILYLRETLELQSSDDLFIRVYRNNALDVNNPEFSYDGVTDFDLPVGSTYVFESLLTAPAGGWDWTDFQNDVTELQIEGKGTGSINGDIGLDAAAYVVTTDEQCGGADSTISYLPLTDTYDADLLEFVSADPPHSSVSTGGSSPNTTGTITWDDLGPLYAGGTKRITVTFKALTQTTGTTNTTGVTGAKFASGRDVNDDSDTDDVGINVSGSISGTIWADTNNDGWVGITGYDTISDTRIPNVTVELYACYDPTTGLIIDPATRTSQQLNKDCEDNANGGEWRLVTTTTTDGDGNYLFDGLRDGFYNVKVDETTLLSGFTTRSAETDPAGNGSGSTCGTCDGQWNTDTAALGTFNSVDNSGGGESITDVSFGYRDPTNGAVTGYVWNDRDGDGIWDADEEPIPGVPIYLCATGICSSGNYSATITTDANGFYSFTGITGTYRIGIEADDLPGMSQSGDPDEAGTCIVCDSRTTTSFTIDPSEVEGPYNFGYTGGLSIGDTIYADWNGDGTQDSGEEGLSGVQVSLYRDVDGDGVIDDTDTLLDTQTTNASGVYSFTNLAGNGNQYIVAVNESTIPTGYSQTGDPDEGATTCTICDARASVTLSTTNVLTADFGYQPQGFGSIGDLVWKDTDGDGVEDADESGISGVTVSLYQDQDGDGVIDPEDALVITQTTDASGNYTFTNLISGTYIVQVDSTNFNTGQPLDGLTQSNGTQDNLHAVELSDGENYTDADFGYASSAIGDFIWQDNDGDGTQDAGEPGISGITVTLYIDVNGNGTYDPGTDTLYATTTTDADGLYEFTGLVSDTYVVVVDTGSPALSGFTLTYDPDAYSTSGTFPPCDPADPGLTNCEGESGVSLSLGQIDRSHDFGFRPSRAIGDFVWLDSNGDGAQDPGESGIGGVVITLTVTSGQVFTTTTDSDGFYSFGSDVLTTTGFYTVEIDTTTLPPTTTQTYDFDGTLDNRTVINVTDSFTTNFDIDFGYQLTGTYFISGTVFYDDGGTTDGTDDIFDPATDTPYSGVTLYLWDSSGNPLGTTTTDASGHYTFTNLPAGDYTVSLSQLPQFANLDLTAAPTGSGTVYKTGIDLGPTSQTDIDFGFFGAGPTLITLSAFEAYEDNGRVVVQWDTASEIGTLGFDLYRQDKVTGEYRPVNQELLLGLLHATQGGIYRYVDETASPGETYTYWLVEVQYSGEERSYGPFTVAVGPKPAGVSPMVSNYTAETHPVSADTEERIQAALAVQSLAVAEMPAGGADETVTAAKVAVTEDGLYYLDAADIASVMQLDYQEVVDIINQGHLQLSNLGQPVGYVASGDTGLYFYGEAPESIYTRENIYWLQTGSSGGGVPATIYLPLIIKAGDSPAEASVQANDSGGITPASIGGPIPTDGQETFTDKLYVEEDLWPQPNMFTDPQGDYWFWDYIVGGNATYGSKTFTLQADGAAAAGTATLTVYLHGFSSTGADPDHHVVITLNGVQVGQSWWDGATAHQVVLPIDQSLLNDGANSVEVTGLLDPGVSYSVFFIDSFELSYQRHYRAVNDVLLARGEGHPVVTVEGFSDPTIQVFDVTDPRAPQLVTTTTLDGVAGNYRVSFSPASVDGLYVAVAPAGVRNPLSMVGDVASNLQDSSNGADYLVIVPPNRKYQIQAAAQVLADYRQGQGLEAMLVDLEDIYDEFNYGLSSPEAIRSFLAYAYGNWQKAPRYVVLAGEGSLDYKNNLGHGDSLIPPLLANTPYGMFAADNRFGDVVGSDGVPEIAIGRLPILTPAELQALVDKIITYEGAGDGTWQKQVLMLADDPDIEDGNFPADSDAVAALVPPSHTVEKIYLSDYSTGEARQQVLDSFNGGVKLVNYIGHGGPDRLAHEGLLRVTDVDSLVNGEKLPVMAGLTCSIGQFEAPGYDSLGETLTLKNGGGAVAVWSPSGLSLNDEAKILNEAFFQETFSGDQALLGEAILDALGTYQVQGGQRFMLDIYNLLGDPALQIAD